MTFWKMLLGTLVFIVAALAMTIVYVVVLSRGAKAIGIDALLAMTIYSALYWLLIAAPLAAVWWPLRRWLF